MHCPYCRHEDSRVVDSRSLDDGSAIRRRRQCAGCTQRFTTIERVQLRELTVLKNDGRRVHFDRDKLSRSIALITQPAEASTERLDKVRELLAQHVAAVVVIPFDPALDEGDEIDWDRLHKKTRRAYLEATAALIEGLA